MTGEDRERILPYEKGDNTRERSRTNTTTTNTRQKEESRAVMSAGMKGCPDINPGHHQVGLLQQSRILGYRLILIILRKRDKEQRGLKRKTTSTSAQGREEDDRHYQKLT